MQSEELLKMLEEKDIKILDNQPFIDKMNNGYDTTSLYGPPPGMENLIAGAFTEHMPNATPSQEVTPEIQNNITLNTPNTLELS